MTSAPRIAVLMGGPSSEREVSLQSGTAVATALQSRGCDAIALDWEPGTNLAQLLAQAQIDVVWNALHGTPGEDGSVQGLLQCLDIPYTGSGIAASAMAIDKAISKRVFEQFSIPTPPWQLLRPHETAGDVTLPLPLVVKPALEGSSVGVTIVRESDDLDPAITLARRFHGATLVEQFIDGVEMCTSILDDDIVASIQIVAAETFYDYEAKYQRDDTQYLLPPHLAQETLRRAEEFSLHAHRALGCRGYSRIDLMVDRAGNPFVLEVNTLPGMTSHSLLPKAAAHVGIDFPELCMRILAPALAQLASTRER